MNRKEFKADHFKTMEELLDTIDTWLDNEELYGTLYDDFNRFFDTGAMEEMYYYIKHLQNNWNELKKFVKERIKNANKCLNNPNENWDEDTNGYVLARKFQLEEMLKAMQELEGNNE